MGRFGRGNREEWEQRNTGAAGFYGTVVVFPGFGALADGSDTGVPGGAWARRGEVARSEVGRYTILPLLTVFRGA